MLVLWLIVVLGLVSTAIVVDTREAAALSGNARARVVGRYAARVALRRRRRRSSPRWRHAPTPSSASAISTSSMPRFQGVAKPPLATPCSPSRSWT
jgi:hypothetical protein